MNELIALEKIAGWEKLKTLVLDSVSFAASTLGFLGALLVNSYAIADSCIPMARMRA